MAVDCILALNAEHFYGVKADRELLVVWAVAKGTLFTVNVCWSIVEEYFKTKNKCLIDAKS